MPGPYVQAALFCERALQEQDGVASLIRVVDRLTVAVQAPAGLLPDELPEGQLQTTFVVMLKSGDAQGRSPITISIEQPSGITLPPQSVDVMFEGADRGVNLVLNMAIPATEGLYWFTVSCDGRELTRAPLRVIYQRMPIGPGTSGSR